MPIKPLIAKGVTLSGFPGLDTPTNYNLKTFQITPASVDTIEVSDMQDPSMIRDYVPGMVTLGDVTLSLSGPPKAQLTEGAVGIATISIGGTTIFSQPVILVEQGSASADVGGEIGFDMKFKILKSGSMALSGSSGSSSGSQTPAATGGEEEGGGN